MQIFATAILAAVAVASSYDVAIKEGEKTAFDATFMTSYKVTGEGANQTMTGIIENSITMADGYVNEDLKGVAYTYLCQGEGTEAKTCFEMKFENEAKTSQQHIKVTAYEVLDAKIKIPTAKAETLTSAGGYFSSSGVGKQVGEKEAQKLKDASAFTLRKPTGIMSEEIDLASCKVDEASGYVKLTSTLAVAEANVTKGKEELAKGATKGVIGGFYKKRGEAKDVAGIWGEKEITSFDISDADSALAFSMAGAITAAALAF